MRGRNASAVRPVMSDDALPATDPVVPGQGFSPGYLQPIRFKRSTCRGDTCSSTARAPWRLEFRQDALLMRGCAGIIWAAGSESFRCSNALRDGQSKWTLRCIFDVDDDQLGDSSRRLMRAVTFLNGVGHGHGLMQDCAGQRRSCTPFLPEDRSRFAVDEPFARFSTKKHTRRHNWITATSMKALRDVARECGSIERTVWLTW